MFAHIALAPSCIPCRCKFAPVVALGYHLANLVGAYALFWDHLADLITARLDPLLLNHFADFVTLLFDNGFPLIANTVNLLFADFRNPYLFANCP